MSRCCWVRSGNVAIQGGHTILKDWPQPQRAAGWRSLRDMDVLAWQTRSVIVRTSGYAAILTSPI